MSMRRGNCIGCALAALATIASAEADTAPAAAPAAQQVVPGVWLIPGGTRPDRQPDGNSVILDAPAGLIVVDTGRHAWHREAILSLARARDRKIVAIVNTHWHLDHASGNPDLRAEYPDLRVYASNAIDGALAGFFPASAKDSAAYLDDPQVPPDTRDDIRGDLLTMENGAALKPDVVISASGTVTLGGRVLRINLAPDAVTAGDAVAVRRTEPPGRARRSRHPAGAVPRHRVPGRLEGRAAEVAATPFDGPFPATATR